jgi:hypothetical protein
MPHATAHNVSRIMRLICLMLPDATMSCHPSCADILMHLVLAARAALLNATTVRHNTTLFAPHVVLTLLIQCCCFGAGPLLCCALEANGTCCYWDAGGSVAAITPSTCCNLNKAHRPVRYQTAHCCIHLVWHKHGGANLLRPLHAICCRDRAA